MNNREIQAAWKYHNGTKHSYWSIRNNPHFLDWANRPQPFKIYPQLEQLPLPRDVPQTGVAALSAISQRELSWRNESVPDLRDLACILYFSAGITKQRVHPGGEIYFRAAACTGALYEIELYVVSIDLPGLDAGVYHFSPADVSLRLLRKGDFRGNLAQATAMEPAVAHASATIICTGTYWRNAWKYQARTYRHFGWDNGTLLANMLAVSAASGLPAKIVLGFVDAEVNRLLPGLGDTRAVRIDASSAAVGRSLAELNLRGRSGATVLAHLCNLGYGRAIQTAVIYAQRAGYDRLVTLDADGQHDPAQVRALLAEFDTRQWDVLIGSRYVLKREYTGVPFGRRVGMRLFSLLVRLMAGRRVYDTTSGLKVIGRQTFASLTKWQFIDFHAEAIVYLMRLGYRIGEFPITVDERRHGVTMYSALSHIKYPLKTALMVVLGVVEASLTRKRPS